MSGLIACISAFFSAFSQHRDLALENLALRQQLAIFKRRHPRPRLRPTDRLFWVWLSKIWAGWREALIIVKPETVIAWHRQVFRFYWRWLSRRKSIGRPTVSAEVRTLIKQMAQANPLWGAPRIHGELQNLGLEVSERTVSRLMPRRREAPSQSWRTFLDNHLRDIIASARLHPPRAWRNISRDSVRFLSHHPGTVTVSQSRENKFLSITALFEV
jgi:putative transposase